MRLSNLLRLLTLALLLAGTLALPAVDAPGLVAVADDGGDDDNDDGNEGQGNNDDDDDNQGRGNDDDDDSEGQGNNNRNDDKDDDPDDGNAGRGNDDKDDNDNVTAAAAYQVDVTCEPDAAADDTTCTFTPLTPDGGKQVSHLVVPAELACAEVLGGDGDYVDPDPTMSVTGYRFTGNGPYTLVFSGTVTATGSATYWVKAASGVYPAAGAGLACDVAATLDDAAGKATPEPTAPPVTTGTVVVEAFACVNVPADTTDFDWYGACDPDTAAHRYLLAQDTAATNPLLAAQTDDTGAAAFTDLGPGAYSLDDADARWCKAESDNVNTDGNVVVEAGATTTVWLFYCHDGGS
jgi:hypothetical protein